MEVQAYISDLSPIEHFWDKLEQRIAARPMYQFHFLKLKIPILEEWKKIRSLIETSLHQRNTGEQQS